MLNMSLATCFLTVIGTKQKAHYCYAAIFLLLPSWAEMTVQRLSLPLVSGLLISEGATFYAQYHLPRARLRHIPGAFGYLERISEDALRMWVESDTPRVSVLPLPLTSCVKLAS